MSVPVIYITGNENLAVREAALNSGCLAFLTKPFSAQELIEPLKKHRQRVHRFHHNRQTTGAVNAPLIDWEDH